MSPPLLSILSFLSFPPLSSYSSQWQPEQWRLRVERREGVEKKMNGFFSFFEREMRDFEELNFFKKIGSERGSVGAHFLHLIHIIACYREIWLVIQSGGV
jgi:hypothetical protein